VTEAEEARMEAIAKMTADYLLDSPRMRKIIREVVIEIMIQIEEKELRRTAIIVLDECRQHSVKLYVRRGTLYATPWRKVSPELHDLIERNKGAVIEYLQPNRNGRPWK
jgi:hypothetical protein